MKKILFVLIGMFLFSGMIVAQDYDSYSHPMKNRKVLVKKEGKENKTTTHDYLKEKIEYLKNLDEYRRINDVPEDFPKFEDTGHPKADLDRYYRAKQEWIKNNPEKFEKIKHLNL